MREILFRGKQTDNGEWVEGFYCPCCFGRFPCNSAIVPKEEMDSGGWTPKEIISETVGQYTGIERLTKEKFSVWSEQEKPVWEYMNRIQDKSKEEV